MGLDQGTFLLAMGILGNIFAVLVYLSPVPTFIRIYKKGSTEGFQSMPYVVALFSSMLWLYYALIKRDDLFLISINIVGCTIETVYVALFYVYAPKKTKIFTAKLVLLVNLVAFSLIFGFTYFIKMSNSQRVFTVGVICAVFTAGVFMAPLAIMVKVIRTRSLEYMPFPLSCFLTISSITWFFYGLLQKNPFVWLPNITGFIFAVLQLVIYGVCKYSFAKVEKNNQAKEAAKISHDLILGFNDCKGLQLQTNNKEAEHQGQEEQQVTAKVGGGVQERQEGSRDSIV